MNIDVLKEFQGINKRQKKKQVQTSFFLPQNAPWKKKSTKTSFIAMNHTVFC